MQKIEQFIENLDDLLKNKPLPGIKAHSLMLPEFRFSKEFLTNVNNKAKKSSVLVLQYSCVLF